MKEYDIVVALSDLDEGRVKKGAEGTIIHTHTNPAGYEVDFMLDGGADWIVVSCEPHEVALRSEPTRKTA
jgi:hypothetical protein